MKTTPSDTTRAEFCSTDLDTLRRQLAAWRAAQSGRPRLPEPLWKAAATLASSEGLSWVARALRLDYHRLQRRCGTAQPKTRPKPNERARFVEVPWPGAPLAEPSRWHIELFGDGDRRMSVGGPQDPASLSALIGAFFPGRS